MIILDFFKTIYLSLKRILQGNAIFVQPKDYNNRLSICKECSHLLGTHIKNYRCKLCKCYLDIKIKPAESKCPINNWGRIDY